MYYLNKSPEELSSKLRKIQRRVSLSVEHPSHAHLVAFSTKGNEVTVRNLVPGHCYACIGAKLEDGEVWFLLQNPHYYTCDVNVDRPKVFEKSDFSDGRFWINEKDLLKNFLAMHVGISRSVFDLSEQNSPSDTGFVPPCIPVEQNGIIANVSQSGRSEIMW